MQQKYRHWKKGHVYQMVQIVTCLIENEDYVLYHRVLENDQEPRIQYFAREETTLSVFFVDLKKGIAIPLEKKEVLPQQELENITLWLRKVEDFFGYKEKEKGIFVPRFVRI